MELPEDQRAAEMQRMRLMPGDPRLTAFAGIQNPVAEMDIDIIIEDAPDTVTIQGEQFEHLMQIFPALANMPPQLAKVAIKASQLRNKDELIEMLEGGGEQNAQQQQIQQMQQQMQQIMAQLGIEKAKAEVAKVGSEVELNRARAMNEIQNAQMPPTLATLGR